MESQKLSSEDLDQERKRKQAYEYLCHLEEAKIWLENVLKKNLGASCDLEQSLRNGVDLAILSTIIAPEKCQKSRIFDLDLKKYEEKGLIFKHTDNIMMFIRGCSACGLPKIFIPETLDLYDMKNTAKVIFCIHALAHFLAKKGVLPLITSLYGQVEFGEAEISKIQKYLEKSGMKLPAFSKIGGILAGELSEDDAAIHAAVLLISEALGSDNLELFLERLKNPCLNLLRIRDFNAKLYWEEMIMRRDKKISLYESNKTDTKEEDVYDKILNRNEIQDCIFKINIDELVRGINHACSDHNLQKIAEIYSIDDFVQHYAHADRSQIYSSNTLTIYDKNDHKPFDLKDIEKIIQDTNKSEETRIKINNFITELNDAVISNDTEKLLKCLKKPPKPYEPNDFPANKSSLIMTEITNYLKSCALTPENLPELLNRLKLVCLLNKALDNNDDKLCYEILNHSDMRINDLDKGMSKTYLESLLNLRNEKIINAQNHNDKHEPKCIDLSYNEIYNNITDLNRKIQDEMFKMETVNKINENLDKISADELLLLLMDSKGQFKNVFPENRHAYHQALLHEKQNIENNTEHAHNFWHNQIQETIDSYNNIMKKIREKVSTLNELNESILAGNDRGISMSIINLEVGGVIPECSKKYFDEMSKVLGSRNLSQWNGWLDHTFFHKDYHNIYYNHKNHQYKLFSPPEEYKDNIGYLNTKIIGDIYNRVGSDYNRELYFKSNTDSIITLQSMYKTIENYRKYHNHLNFINKQLPNLVILQAFSRTIKVRSSYLSRLKYIFEHQDDACVLKLYYRAVNRRKFFKHKCEMYKNNIDYIVNLQSLIRTFTAQNDYYNLINMTCPSLKQVYKYLHLLELDDNDVLEEREVNRLKNLVFDKIKESGDLEEEVKSRYLLIGILINNRQSLKDLETESSKSKRKTRGSHITQISKEKIELFEKYGHVFYILQHKPEYISRMLLRIASSHSTKYMREYFLTLFNFGTTSRDEYLMLRALRMCLDFEVTTNINSIQELSKDDPAAFKIAISFWRDVKAPTFLQQMLSEPINEIMKIKGVITVNPVDVYKQWVSKIESETGKSSELPYDVEPEEALKHEEVQNQIKKNIGVVIEMATHLRDSVLNNKDFIPYGIRYFSKCIYDSLNQKFEDAPEEEKLKVVANLLYYRFINPPTVSPEAFNLLKDKTEVSTEERRNLAQISSILQKASANVLSDSSHPLVQPLDDFVKESAQKFMHFFKMCIDVPPLEQYYNINQFTDRTQVRTPELKLTFSLILETHRMLIDHADIVFPQEDDVLQQIIKDIGDVPELTSLVDYHPPEKSGKGDKNAAEQVVENIEDILGNATTSLPLVPPKVLLETEENKYQELLNDTINKLVDILHFSICETIPQVLQSTFTDDQEKNYKQLLARREKVVAEKAPELANEDRADSIDSNEEIEFATLSETLQIVTGQIASLEENHVVKPDNDYNDLLLAIVRKIVQRTQYVKSRKIELARFRSTYDDLQNKIVNLGKQLDYYNLYIKGCVTNMAQKKKTKKKSIKKSAQKLIQKGVIVDIEGISPDKFKNVMVVISTTDEPGVYEISGEFIGISVDTYKCRLNFQDLLQLKFDNVAVLRIMNIVKVRVNLLIHMINVNFHV